MSPVTNEDWNEGVTHVDILFVCVTITSVVDDAALLIELTSFSSSSEVDFRLSLIIGSL